MTSDIDNASLHALRARAANAGQKCSAWLHTSHVALASTVYTYQYYRVRAYAHTVHIILPADTIIYYLYESAVTTQ